jgi:hypothetical protein
LIFSRKNRYGAIAIFHAASQEAFAMVDGRRVPYASDHRRVDDDRTQAERARIEERVQEWRQLLIQRDFTGTSVGLEARMTGSPGRDRGSLRRH